MSTLVPSHVLPGHYSLNLIFLSIIIAILASYVALDLAGRVTNAQAQIRRWWLLGGALAMGTGIWSMHFIGMLAYSLPVVIRYDIPTVIVSHVAAVIASGVALHVVSRRALDYWSFLIGGILMGIGITAMHYIGMTAMRLGATVQYDVGLVILSVLIAIGASFSGLWIAFRLRAATSKIGILKKILGSVVMGSAIPAMHYTGMAAASFVVINSVVVKSPFAVDISSLGGSAIIIGTFFILSMTLLTSMVDRRFTAQAAELHQTNEKLKLEIQARDQVERELRIIQEELERRVTERTFELSEANTLLKREMTERENSQREIASLAKFPDENPHPIFRITADGDILYQNKASHVLLNEWGCWEEKKLKGWAYHAARSALDSHQPVYMEVECGNRVYSTTFAPIPESHYINVYAFDITERRRAEEESHGLMYNLGERVKELTVLHQTARLLQDPNFTPEDVVQRFVGLIPSGWQYSEDTAARFSYDSMEIATPNFVVTPWAQRAEFMTGDGKKGLLEVCYVNEKPEQNEGPFTIEERNLLNSLAEMLRAFFERKRIEHALEVRSRFEDLIATLSTNFINLPTDQIDPGINEALRKIGEFAGVDRSYVFLFSEDGTRVNNTHEWYVKGLKPQKDHFQEISVDSIPWGMEQLIQFQPIYIPRVADLPPEASAEKALIWSLEEIQSLIIVPMVRQGSVIGFLGFDAVFSEKTWDEDSAVLLRMVGEIFANAIERKQAEENLRLNQFFMDRAGDMIFLVRSDARFCYVNEKACDSLGYSRQELLSMNVYDISPEHQAGDWQDHWEKTKKASTTTFEAQIQTKHGGVFSAEVTVNFLEFHGVEYHCSFVRDITERKKTDEALRVAKEELEQRVEIRTAELSKTNIRLTQEIAERERSENALRQAEKKYHSIVENAVEGIYQSTPEGRFISVNSALARMYGYHTPEELQSKVVDIEGQVYADSTQRKQFVHLLEEKGRVEGFECQVYRKDGTVFWISEYARSVKDENGHVLYYEGTIQDITARKRAEEDLQQAKEIAESANNAKSEFLANMSHELRTPLNGILGYAQILNRDPNLGESQKSGVDVIQRSGEHLLMLINDILDLSKIESQKLEIQPTPFQLQDFLNMIADITRVRAEQAGLTFIYEPASSLPRGVFGDDKRLRQVLLNLLGNAVKFTEQGTVVLKVQYDYSMPDEPNLVVEVEDSGIGIAPDHLDEIFLPFRQVTDRRRQVEGTGLGLAITKKLLTLMGGVLHVNSTPGVGSVFHFSIPLPESTEYPVSSYQDARTIIGFTGKPAHVLVVDDKWENRAVISNFLLPLGFTISEAANGREGVTKAMEGRPDMVLMDLVMPVMDGFEATRKIRQVSGCKDMKIIALSASVFEESRQKSREAGCTDFLPKPVQAEGLFEKLQMHLGFEWVYESAKKAESKKAEQLVVPPQEELVTILEAVKKGRIMAIREDINRIEQLDPLYAPFVEELRQLTKEFKMKQLGEFLTKYLEKQNSA